MRAKGLLAPSFPSAALSSLLLCPSLFSSPRTSRPAADAQVLGYKLEEHYQGKPVKFCKDTRAWLESGCPEREVPCVYIIRHACPKAPSLVVACKSLRPRSAFEQHLSHTMCVFVCLCVSVCVCVCLCVCVHMHTDA